MKHLDSWIERKESEIQIFELIQVMRTSSHFMGLWVMFQKSTVNHVVHPLKIISEK